MGCRVWGFLKNRVAVFQVQAQEGAEAADGNECKASQRAARISRRRGLLCIMNPIQADCVSLYRSSFNINLTRAARVSHRHGLLCNMNLTRATHASHRRAPFNINLT